jgi:ABC-2 type transport system ATP-binding protein
MDEAEHCGTLAFIHAGRIIARGSPEAIKTSAMRGGILEIAAEPWPQVMSLLGSWPSVREPALHGTAIHVVVDDPEHAAPAVTGFLRQHGFAVRHVRPRAPSLEDVFVSLVEPDARAAGRPAGGDDTATREEHPDA